MYMTSLSVCCSSSTQVLRRVFLLVNRTVFLRFMSIKRQRWRGNGCRWWNVYYDDDRDRLSTSMKDNRGNTGSIHCVMFVLITCRSNEITENTTRAVLSLSLARLTSRDNGKIIQLSDCRSTRYEMGTNDFRFDLHRLTTASLSRRSMTRRTKLWIWRFSNRAHTMHDGIVHHRARHSRANNVISISIVNEIRRATRQKNWVGERTH